MYSHNENKHRNKCNIKGKINAFIHSLFRNLSLSGCSSKERIVTCHSNAVASRIRKRMSLWFSWFCCTARKNSPKMHMQIPEWSIPSIQCFAIIVHACAFPLLRIFLARKFELWHKTVRSHSSHWPVVRLKIEFLLNWLESIVFFQNNHKFII